MAFIDFILNVVGLLLWLNWRAVYADPLVRRSPLTLVGTLKGARPSSLNPWKFPVALLLLLVVRALLYWKVGPSAIWVPRIDLFFVVLAFRADLLGSCAVFSGLSFLRALVIFYFWLFILAFINRGMSESDPVHRLIKTQLGIVAQLPRLLQLLLPFVSACILWAALHPLLVWTGTVEAITLVSLLKQGLLVALSLFFSLKFLLPAFLLLHLVLTYVYVGQSPLLDYIGATARSLTAPFRRLPLAIGRIDLAPVLAAIIILLLLDALPRYVLASFSRKNPIWP